MSQVNFGDLLNTRRDEIKPPAALPSGTWLFAIGKQTPVKSGQKQTPGIQFELKAIAPDSDVVMSEAEQAEEWSGKTVRTTFWITDTALFMLEDFLKMIPATEGTATLSEALAVVEGQQIKGYATRKTAEPKPGDDPNAPPKYFTEITSWSAA